MVNPELYCCKGEELNQVFILAGKSLIQRMRPDFSKKRGAIFQPQSFNYTPYGGVGGKKDHLVRTPLPFLSLKCSPPQV